MYSRLSPSITDYLHRPFSEELPKFLQKEKTRATVHTNKVGVKNVFK